MCLAFKPKNLGVKRNVFHPVYLFKIDKIPKESIPDERLTPTQVLDLDWFSGDLKTEYEKLLGIYQREQKKRKKKQKKEQAREQAKQQANNK